MKKWIVLFLISFFVWLKVPLAWEHSCSWHKKVRIIGKILEWRPPLMIIQTSSGEKFYVRLGPYRFLKEELKFKAGEKVTVKGWLCGDMLLPETVESGEGRLRLRDERGWPLWKKSPFRKNCDHSKRFKIWW